jgi:hypothetical protein
VVVAAVCGVTLAPHLRLHFAGSLVDPFGRLLETAPVRGPGLCVFLEAGGVLAPLLEPQLVGLAAATRKLRLRVLTPIGHQKRKSSTRKIK